MSRRLYAMRRSEVGAWSSLQIGGAGHDVTHRTAVAGMFKPDVFSKESSKVFGNPSEKPSNSRAGSTNKKPRSGARLRQKEAPVGVEPTMEVLQTSALPLGYSAFGKSKHATGVLDHTRPISRGQDDFPIKTMRRRQIFGHGLPAVWSDPGGIFAIRFRVEPGLDRTRLRKRELGKLVRPMAEGSGATPET